MTPILAAFALVGLWCLMWAPFFWCCCGPPPPCDTTLNVTVLGCWDGGIEGVTLNLKVAAITIETIDTDEDGVGQIIASQPSGTAAILEVIPPSGCGFETQYINLSLDCDTQNIEVVLDVDEDHFCCGSNDYPIPIGPLDFTCSNGSGTLDYDGSGSWSGVVSLTVRIGKPTPWNTYDCTCPPPTGVLTVAKFEYYTTATDFLVTYACGGGGAITVSFPAGTGDPVWVWFGRDDCTTCDWCFGGAAHDVPAAEFGMLSVFQSGGSETSSCGAYSASGTMAAASGSQVVNNFDCPLDPTDPGTCNVTPGSLVGSWAVST